MTNTDIVDILVIGGGINGTGIARDAAGRGLSVVLAEKNDLASGTSSKSSKLIHGGLRYLEYGEFRLVREALIEREVLLRAAPHLVRQLRIVLPHHKALRPKWMLRLGLFVYDHLGGRKILPPTSVANLRTGPFASILKPAFKSGFVFSDCWVDDARLVALNAVDAYQRGARILTRHKCTALSHDGKIWTASLTGRAGRSPKTIRARAIVNASGIRVDEMVELALGREHEDHLRLVKGSHIVTRKLYEGRHLYMFQNPDKRIIFAIPYEQDYTLIGTTDAPYALSDGEIKISNEETDYLLSAASSYFATPVTRDDIVWDYAGVRPLYDSKESNASAVTRDYVFDLIADETPPLLSIFGGKITTYRELSEHALEKLSVYFPSVGGPWTADAALPGGDLTDADFETFFATCCDKYDWLAPNIVRRMARAYGTKINDVIGKARSRNEMGEWFGGGLSAREVSYLQTAEWAVDCEDILWRRTKCGLHMSAAQREHFAKWLEQKTASL